MKVSWQYELKQRVKYLEMENFKLNQLIASQANQIKLLEKLANINPSVMAACERMTDAAAHQVSDMLGFLKETRHGR